MSTLCERVGRSRVSSTWTSKDVDGRPRIYVRKCVQGILCRSLCEGLQQFGNFNVWKVRLHNLSKSTRLLFRRWSGRCTRHAEGTIERCEQGKRCASSPPCTAGRLGMVAFPNWKYNTSWLPLLSLSSHSNIVYLVASNMRIKDKAEPKRTKRIQQENGRKCSTRLELPS